LQLVTVAVVLWLAAGNYGAVVVVVTAVMVLWLAADDVLLNCGRRFLSFCRSGDVDSCCWWLWLIGAFFHVTAVIFADFFIHLHLRSVLWFMPMRSSIEVGG
jgi:hypothetical protein